MASKAITKSFRQFVAKRNYSAAAVCNPSPNESIEFGVVPSKTFVAGWNNGSPVTRVTVAFRAGSRYECPNDLGVAHMVRCAAGLTTGNCTSFMLARKLAQVGASLTASGDREMIYYTIETTFKNLNVALECLTDTVSNQQFRPWEISELGPRLKYDIAALSPQARAMDLVHRAAFRRGLGNSLFIAPKRIGSISAESIQHFASVNLNPARCAVTIVGDSQEKATVVAQKLQLPSGAGTQEPASQYFGGELRKEIGGELAHIVLALKGAPVGSPDSYALAVAAKALGNGPSCKWGSDNSVLGRALAGIGPSAAAGFSVSYSDAGLFGVVLTVPKNEAGKASKAVAALLKNKCLDSKAIEAGKKQLQLQILSEGENGTTTSENLAAQGLYHACAKTPSTYAAEVGNLNSGAVTQALSTAANSCMSMAAVGNLACTPYVDELA